MGYLYNYAFPEPNIRIFEETDPNENTITPDTYEIAITGVKGANETKINESVELTIAANHYALLQFPKLPIYKSMFDSYNVYVKSNTNWLKIDNYEHEQKDCNLLVKLNSFDALVPNEMYQNNEFLVPFANMMVLKSYVDMDENYLEDGFWCGYVMLDIQNPGFAEDPNQPLLGRVVVTVKLRE